MNNPYAPPSHIDDVETSLYVSRRRARTIIWAIGFTAIVFDVFIMAELGRVQAVILGRMAATSLLLYFVYFRRKWARLLLVSLFVLTSLLNAVQLPLLGWSFWGVVTTTWILFHLVAGAVVVISPSFASRASSDRVPVPTHDESDDDDDDDDDDDE